MSTAAINAYRTQAGQAYRDDLVAAHLSLVRHVLGRVGSTLPAQVDRENLEGAGLLGLVEAAQNFDPNRGVAFKTFAYRRVQGAILDELRRNSPLPQKLLRQIAQVRRLCETEEGPVTPERIQTLTDMSEEEVGQTLEAMRLGFIQSWDESRTLASGLRKVNESQPDIHAEREELRELLAKGLAALPDRERLVITLYYLEELRLKEIGKVLELSESRVSRILSKAEFRLGEWIRAHGG